MNLLTFLFSYLNSMTNTNAVSILTSLHTFLFSYQHSTYQTPTKFIFLFISPPAHP